jgi:hypothetical protein
MQTVLENVQCNRHGYYQTIIKESELFIYREKRYNLSFSLVAVCSKEQTALDSQNIQKALRKTDQVIKINDDLLCIIFENSSNISYLKAAENLNAVLKQTHYKENFFISTAESQEFNSNYLNMINSLFQRLEYAITNNISNTVIYQDYII